MDFYECKKKIEQGIIHPVYFFFGEEPYYLDHLVKYIVDTCVDPATKDFNCDILQAEESDGDGIVAMASSFPMMADKRIIVVKNVQKLSTADKKRIGGYVVSPLESTILVLTAKKIDRRQQFYAGLIKHAAWVESKPLYENQAVDWIVQHLKEQQVTIVHDAASFLVQQVGTSIWNLENELNKLLTYCNYKKQIIMDDVTAVAGVSRKYNTWELADAVGRKDLKTSIAIVKHLFEEGASAPGILITLTQRMLLLTQVRSALDKNMPSQQIAQVLKMKPFFVKLYVQQASQYSMNQLTRSLKILRNADLAVKTGYMKPLMVITLVLCDLTRSSSVEPYFYKNF